jgi:predicted porin
MTSLKKLIAVLAVSLPLAAAAQTATDAAKPAEAVKPPPPLATIYGTLNFNAMYIEAPNATKAGARIVGREAVSPDSTNIGVRGAADVAFGLQAVYQCETSAFLDGIGASGICNRNSRVGLASPVFGTLFYGNWDTPLKSAYYGTKADDPFGNTDVYGANDLMGSPGFNRLSSAWRTANDAGGVASFDIRAQNSIAYHSPKIPVPGFGAVTAKAQYSVDEFATNNGDVAPRLFGAGVNYEGDGLLKGLSVLAAYERHDDSAAMDVFNASSTTTTFGIPGTAYRNADKDGKYIDAGNNPFATTGKDQAWRVGAGYELSHPFGATAVGFVWEQLKFEQVGHAGTAPGGVKSYKRAAFQVSLKHRMGNHELRARFNDAEPGDCEFFNQTAACSTNGYGAKEYALGYAYYLAKSTQLYASWAQIENAKNATYTMGAGGGNSGAPAIVGKTPAGSDPWALGLGVRYAF